MSAVESRKIIRLGNSSLSVTLPHRWAKALGLKPGDEVLMSIEGESIKISPRGTKERRTLEIKDRRLARYAVPCAYILGYDDVIIYFDQEGSATPLKESAHSLLGVRVKPWDGGRAEARIVVDHEMIDLRELIRDLKRLLVEALELLAKALEGKDVSEALEAARKEFYSIRSLTERLMHSDATSDADRRRLLTIFSSLTLMGLATSLLHDMAQRPRASSAGELLQGLMEVVDVIALNVLNPSQQRLAQALSSLESVDSKLRSIAEQGDAAAYRLLDVIKIMQIIAYSLLCYAMIKREDR